MSGHHYVMSEQDTLEYRMERLEDELRQVNKTLTEVRDRVLSTVNCPAPGSCLALKTIVEDQGRAIAKLERWQAGIMMLGSVLIVLATIFGPTIREALFPH